eukprot:scaffold15705_cov83-Phaeocystis_antarctica.AAC.3
MAARANFCDRSSFCECDLMGLRRRHMAVQKLDMMQITFMRSLLVPVSSGRAGASTCSTFSSHLEQGAGRRTACEPLGFLACTTLATKRSPSSRASPIGMTLSPRGRTKRNVPPSDSLGASARGRMTTESFRCTEPTGPPAAGALRPLMGAAAFVLAGAQQMVWRRRGNQPT